tara:strand:+ start:826 stop:1656 length:831 start_codon:yes stop_codon:yes gene_type:complete
MTLIDFNDLPKDGESLLNLARKSINSAITREECEMAIALVKKAADQGYPEAQFELSKFGRWLKLDVHQVLELCTKAANNGFIPAQHDLGIKAYEGYSGEADFEEAIKWFSKADQHGDMESKYWLGTMHIDGKGFHKNMSVGHGLISLAAKKGCKKAKLELAFMYEFGTSFLPINKEKAAEWFLKAMDLFDGTRPDMNYERAISNWWLPAAERGYCEAQFQLARQYEVLDLWDPISRELLAIVWYKRASEQDHVQAQIFLAALLKRIKLERESYARF